MRTRKVFEVLLGLQGLIVEDVEIGDDGIVVKGRRGYQKRTCSGCQRRVRAAYDHSGRRWRHLDIFGRKCFIEVSDVRRLDCPRCGVRVESVPWARHGSAFTRAMEDAVAWLTKRATRTAVSEWCSIAWVTVGSIVGRIVDEELPESRFDNLFAIGVDEFSYGRKKVLTLVVDHLGGGLIWGGEGQGGDTLNQFFDHIGPERAASIRYATMDMDAGYTKSVQARLPQAEIIYDPFHVTQLVNKALDEVRREEMRRAPTGEASRSIKGTRHALRKAPWNLTLEDDRRLRDLQVANRRLYRAYLLKEAILEFYTYADHDRAKGRLLAALAWAARSRLAPFKRLAKSLRKRLASVVRFIACPFSNGRLEATCRHFRMLSARAYGFGSASALLAMGFLFCGKVEVSLPWGSR